MLHCSLALCHPVEPKLLCTDRKAILTMTVLVLVLASPSHHLPKTLCASDEKLLQILGVVETTGLKEDTVKRTGGFHMKTLPNARPRPRSTSHASSAFMSLRFALSPLRSPTVSVISSMPSNTLDRFASVWR